ncbi:MAG TPA: hypothetical protein VK506_06580, partial [Conexibacter sp.]|nr:hypothetical protein [Conexibacter sp.]
FVVACVAYQHDHVYGTAYFRGAPPTTVAYFSARTLVAAVAIALLAALALHHRPTVERLAAATRETTARRAVAIAVAALVTLAYLLSAFNTEGTIGAAHLVVFDHIGYWSEEAFAILGGHAPLVDFHAQYGQLWGYLAAGGMTLLGTSLGVYVGIMLAGTAGAMAAVYATLRRVAGSSLPALALFLPFVATSFFVKAGPLDNRYSPAGLFSVFPIRYAGPYVLLWLVVRRIERKPAPAPVLLFSIAGLVLINNPEFGLPALGATLAALIWTESSRSLVSLARLAGSALAGLAVATVVVSALTLAVAGSLPHFELLLTYLRIYGTEGFGALPMPALGLHLVVYATFAAAIVVATVRSATRERDLVLTGALAWIGIFGLGIGAYFAGRSHPDVLIDLFSAWSLALVLLAVAVVRAILRRPSRRPSAADLLVLAGVGVAACSLAQLPTPWSQVERLGKPQPREARVAAVTTDVVRELTRPGEPVALLIKHGHQSAYEVGIVNVTPYVNIGSMLTSEQWAETAAALRRAGGRQMFIPSTVLFREQIAWLEQAGFEPVETNDLLGIVVFVAR